MFYSAKRQALMFLLVASSVAFMACSVHKAATAPDYFPELEYVNNVIEGDAQSEGVVFVIYSFDKSALRGALPRLLHYASLLRGRGLSMAAVSHGDEMLALTRDNAQKYPGIHRDLKALVNDFGVSFHVCGSFASLNGLSEQDFPEYVDVVPFGPAQVKDYEFLGFERIDMEESL
jgi:intracellular sulfur oxidation DsrE/DsrF family protein